MRARILKLIAALAVMAAALTVCGCMPDRLIYDDEYTLTVDTSDIELGLYETLTLPVPEAATTDGEDALEAVEVEVLFRDGTVAVPQHRYTLDPAFTPYYAGEYYAHYRITVFGHTLAHSTVRIIVRDSMPDDGITIDGVLAEDGWSEGYRTGVDGNLLFRYRFAETGVYVGVEVTDTNLIYNDYLVSRLAQSDGFEVCFNFSGEEGDRLNSTCRKLRLALGGEVYIYSPSTARSVYEINEPMSSAVRYETRLRGTRSLVGEEALTALDRDEGYTFEAFLSYAALGVEAPEGSIGIAFAHRDMTATAEASAVLGGACNRYYSDVLLPDGIRPILSENGKDYEYCTYDHLALTCLYNKLYIGGGHAGIAAPQLDLTVKVDGSGTDSAWSSAAVIDCSAIRSAEVKAKALRADGGLYVYVEVADDKRSAPPLGDVFAGDCIQLIAVSESYAGKSSLEAGFDTEGKVITLSRGGGALCSSLNPAKITYIRGFDRLSALIETDGGYSAEFFIPDYELGEGAGAVCIGVIDNDTESYAGQSKMSYSANSLVPSSYTKIGG